MNIAKRNQLRGTIYRSLAGCFRPPGSEFGVSVEEMSDAICELYPKLVKYLPDVSEGAAAIGADFERLDAVCSTRLDEMARTVVPEMRVMISAEDIIRLCEKVNFPLYKFSGACRIAFLFSLAEYLVHRMVASDSEGATGKDDEIFRDLLMICLAPPATDFFCWIEKSARTAFYRDLARLTPAFLREEAETVK